MDEHEPLRLLEAVCDGIVWPWPDVPPRDDAARRLLAYLGVKGVPAVTAVSVQELSETRDCVAPLCVDEALPGLDHCRRHASIADIRAAREAADAGVSALDRMDAGEPQREPEISTQEEPMAVAAPPAPEHDWPIKVNGTGLRYRDVDEALVAAAEIEADGERVAQDARFDGAEGKADQAIDQSRELANKIRAAAEAFQNGSAVPASGAPAKRQLRRSWRNFWTRERIIQRLRKEPVAPTHADWSGATTEEKPNFQLVIAMFGGKASGWGDALEEAGFERPVRGANRRKSSGRAVAAEKAKPEQAPAAPVVESPAAREVEPAGTGEGEIMPEADRSGSIPETPGNPVGEFTLRLTGSFERDAQRCRDEAEILRRQADALDQIAAGIDELAAA